MGFSVIGTAIGIELNLGNWDILLGTGFIHIVVVSEYFIIEALQASGTRRVWIVSQNVHQYDWTGNKLLPALFFSA